MPKATAEAVKADRDMWVYGPEDEPLLLTEGDDIPEGFKETLTFPEGREA